MSSLKSRIEQLEKERQFQRWLMFERFLEGLTDEQLEDIALYWRFPEPLPEPLPRGASCLLIIWLLQQAPIGSVEACPDRHSQRRSASFSPTLPRRKPASDIWQLVGGRMGSRVRDAGIREPMSW